MYYKDLRDWLKLVDEFGEVARIDGVDWNLEIGALTEMSRNLKGREVVPALLFDNITGYPAGYRVITSLLFSTKRVALTAGIAPEADTLKFTRALFKKVSQAPRIPPKVVETGPVLENLYEGSDVNVLKFPAPRFHEEDGGRYLGTASVTITRDPDDGWVNLGTYRVMVHDEQTLGFYTSPGKHAGFHRNKYWDQGKPCPVAISMGQDPLLFMFSSSSSREGVSEYDLAGGLKGEPIDVIRGPHTGLPIPAHAEIVIEGEAWPDDLREEGPFGEYTGYYGSGMRPEPVIRIKTILHRNDPIITASSPSKPPTDSAFVGARMFSARLWEQMEAAGVPGIQGVWCHPEGALFMLKVVSIKQMYPGHASQALAAVSGTQMGAYMGRYVIVVDEDIDPTNLGEVMWAVCTRSDPERSIDILRRCWSEPLDPGVEPGLNLNSRCLIDACIPYERRDTFPRVVGTSPELREKMTKKFAKFLHGQN